MVQKMAKAKKIQQLLHLAAQEKLCHICFFI